MIKARENGVKTDPNQVDVHQQIKIFEIKYLFTNNALPQADMG